MPANIALIYAGAELGNNTNIQYDLIKRNRSAFEWGDDLPAEGTNYHIDTHTQKNTHFLVDFQ